MTSTFVAFGAGIVAAGVVAVAILRWVAGRAARRGRRGERRAAKVLARLPKNETIVLNDLLIPSRNGRMAQIDHVVLSTRGIFVIETKAHVGRIEGWEHARYWRQHLPMQSHAFYNPLLQNATHLRALRRLLPELDEELFVSVVVFTEAWRVRVEADDFVIPRSLLPDIHIPRTFVPSEARRRRWWELRRKERRLDERQQVVLLADMKEALLRRERCLDREDLGRIAARILAANSNDAHDRRAHVRTVRRTTREAEKSRAW